MSKLSFHAPLYKVGDQVKVDFQGQWWKVTKVMENCRGFGKHSYRIARATEITVWETRIVSAER